MVPVELDGRCVGWRRTTCRARSMQWDKLAPMTCSGSSVEKWAVEAMQAAENGQIVGGGHRRALSGEVVWCQVCGCYSDSRVRGLTDYCKGKPTDSSGGGRAGQLRYLRNNVHPRTRKPLPAPVNERGLDLGGQHVYPELARRSTCEVSASSGRTQQDLGAMVAPRAQHVGKTAAQKLRERLERVRAKERANKASCTMRRLRGKQLPGAEWQQE